MSGTLPSCMRSTSARGEIPRLAAVARISAIDFKNGCEHDEQRQR
jgi:hypothetical protein